MRISVLVLLAVVGATPGLAQTPSHGSWRDAVRQLRTAPEARLTRRSAHVAAIATSIVDESEPNDSFRTADSVALGDQARGVVNPAGDVDTWFVDLTAGQFLSVDVDAAQVGSPLDATLELIAPDGTTSLAFNDDFDGFDSRISYRVPQNGRYYVVIRAFGATGGPGLTYAINFDKVTCPVVGTEQEPNDTPGTAAPVAIDDAGSGEICPHDDNPAGDVDYWAITARAGTTIELEDRKSTRLNSSPSQISSAAFCLKKKNCSPSHLLTYR